MTKTVIVPAGVELQYLEDFPKGAERSVEGSLHVRPATTLHLTGDEWEHIEKAHPELAKRLILVKDTPTLEHHIQRRRQHEKAAAGAAGSPPGGSATTAPPADTPSSPGQEGSENAPAVPPRGLWESPDPVDATRAEEDAKSRALLEPSVPSPDPEKPAVRSGFREPPIIPDPRNRGR